VPLRRVTVPFERLSRWLDGFAERHGEPTAWTRDPDGTEVHAVGGDGAQAWLDVPFPPLADGEPGRELVKHVGRDRTVGVLLVRRGGHAVGIFHGAELTSSKVDARYVQGSTKAGGWSQQRYARRRANQSKAAFAGAADIAAGVLLPQREVLDALVCGGDRRAVDEVLADQRLLALAPLRTGPWLAVPDPRLKVLQATPQQFRVVSIALDP
jgi:hypothetical protein